MIRAMEFLISLSPASKLRSNVQLTLQGYTRAVARIAGRRVQTGIFATAVCHSCRLQVIAAGKR